MNEIPGLVAHADWSAAPAKRWLALATLEAGRYSAQLPQPIGNPQALLGWEDEAGVNGQNQSKE